MLCSLHQAVETRLTDTCGDCGAPRFVVLAGCGFLALQAEPGGTEELTAGVEVGAVWTLVSTVNRHVELGTAHLCTATHENTLFEPCNHPLQKMSCSLSPTILKISIWRRSYRQRKHFLGCISDVGKLQEIICVQSKCVKPRTCPKKWDTWRAYGDTARVLLGAYPGRRSWRTSACWPCTPPPSSGSHSLVYSGSYSASPSHSCAAVLLVCCSSQSHVSHI